MKTNVFTKIALFAACMGLATPSHAFLDKVKEKIANCSLVDGKLPERGAMVVME